MPLNITTTTTLAPNATTAAPATLPAASPLPTAPPPSEDVTSRAAGRKTPNRRKSEVDRRSGLDRRQLAIEDSDYTGPERRSGTERRDTTGLERRRGPGRRRSDDRKAAEEGEMTTEQFEFVMAIETYKKVNKRMYPTWTEILEIVRQLGYKKVQTRTIKLDVPEPDLFKD
jgi:hypothetical protein